MENVQECSNENTDVIKTCEIIKPLQQQQQQQPMGEEIANLKQQQLENPQQQQQEQLTKQNETPSEKPTVTPPITFNEVYDGEDDDEDDDDDEEKDTSQKLIIDIPDDEEEQEEDDKEEDEDDEGDVIPMEETPPVEHLPDKEENNEKNDSKAAEVETIITLSDGEEDIPANEMPSKPGKVQKRRSAGAGSKSVEDEEQFRLKRRKINVAGAPKMPLTGYVRYMNDRRDSLRKEHPTKTSIEHTKMIGEEWHSLPTDVKASYLKAADADKQRYVKELHTFLKSRPDILASELAKNKVRKTAENNSPNSSTTAVAAAAGITATKQQVLKEKQQINDNVKTTKDTTLKDKSTKEVTPIPSTSQQALDINKTVQEKNKNKRTPTPPTTFTNASTSNTTASTAIITPAPGEIPIFTNEFLEHNKIYDMELRSLRKSKTDLELQNSVLEKHVENMKFGVEKMMTENNELEEKNRLLEIYLDKLKRKLAVALASLPLPTAPNGATIDNIDKYMQDLYKMSTSNSHGPATLNKAKDIIRKLDLQIQL